MQEAMRTACAGFNEIYGKIYMMPIIMPNFGLFLVISNVNRCFFFT